MDNNTLVDNNALVNINGDRVPTLELLLMLTLISLLPSLLIMTTSFMRSIIMLFFEKRYGCPAVPAQYGADGDCPVSDIVYHEPCD